MNSKSGTRLAHTYVEEKPSKTAVSGGCKENVVIQSLDRLNLIAKTGASITDRFRGTLAVVDIEDSRSVTLQGFTINGGDTPEIAQNHLRNGRVARRSHSRT